MNREEAGMRCYRMTDSELKFAELVWKEEPVASGDLVKLCGQSFDWKKSTTYTVLKKLCEQKILKNEQAVVTSLIKEEQYHQLQGQEFINENYGGSLPRFLAAFMNQKKLSRKQVEEIRKMIDEYEEE